MPENSHIKNEVTGMAALGSLFRSPFFWLMAATGIGLCLRLWYLFDRSHLLSFKIPYPGLDEELYHLLAQRIASGDILLGHEVYYFSPLYAYFLGAVYALGGESTWVVRILNIFLGAATVGLIFGYTKRFFKSTPIAAIASLAAAIYGPFVVFDTSALKTSFGQFFLALSLFLSARALEKNRTSYWFATGLALGSAFHLSAATGLFILALSFFLLLRPESEAIKPGIKLFFRNGSHALALLAGVILMVLPFTLRNRVVAGEPVLLTVTGGIHLYLGNHKGADGTYSRVQGIRPNAAGHFYDSWKVAERNTARSLTASESSGYWKKRAYAFVLEDPAAFLALTGKKILRIMSPYEIPNNENLHYLKKQSLLLTMLPGATLWLPLGFTGFLISFFSPYRPIILNLYVLSFFTGVCMLFITWRYRLPLFLALLPFSAFFLQQIAYLLKEKRFFRVVLWSLVVLFFVGLGQILPRDSEKKTHLNAAEKKMQLASRQARIVEDLSQKKPSGGKDRAHLWYQLAMIKSGQNDFEGAVRDLNQGLSEFPDHLLLIRYLNMLEKKLEPRR